MCLEKTVLWVVGELGRELQRCSKDDKQGMHCSWPQRTFVVPALRLLTLAVLCRSGAYCKCVFCYLLQRVCKFLCTYLWHWVHKLFWVSKGRSLRRLVSLVPVLDGFFFLSFERCPCFSWYSHATSTVITGLAYTNAFFLFLFFFRRAFEECVHFVRCSEVTIVSCVLWERLLEKGLLFSSNLFFEMKMFRLCFLWIIV